MTHEPDFDHAGPCVAAEEDRPRAISMCSHCGKQLDLVDGEWFTWDAKFLPPENRRPQIEERPSPGASPS